MSSKSNTCFDKLRLYAGNNKSQGIHISNYEKFELCTCTFWIMSEHSGNLRSSRYETQLLITHPPWCKENTVLHPSSSYEDSRSRTHVTVVTGTLGFWLLELSHTTNPSDPVWWVHILSLSFFLDLISDVMHSVGDGMSDTGSRQRPHSGLWEGRYTHVSLFSSALLYTPVTR